MTPIFLKLWLLPHKSCAEPHPVLYTVNLAEIEWYRPTHAGDRLGERLRPEVVAKAHTAISLRGNGELVFVEMGVQALDNLLRLAGATVK